MTEEEFKKLYAEQKAAGASMSLLMQIRFAYETGNLDEIYESLIRTEDFQIREWMRFSAMEGLPAELIRMYEKMTVEEIKESRRKYFLEKEGVQELSATEEEVRNKLQKLQLLVEQAQPMEKFLNVILKQKDALIKNFQMQTEQMAAQNDSLAKQLKECRERIRSMEEKELARKSELAGTDVQTGAGISEDIREPAGRLPGVRRFRFWRRRKADAIVEYIKDPKWDADQMEFLIDCVEDGMNLDDMKRISSPDLPVNKMKLLKKAFTAERSS